MKMVMITYNEAIDMEIMEALEKCGIKNYTKIPATFGKGKTSGTHLGNDVWPGRNNILYVACSTDESKKLFSQITDLRETLGKEGIKAFKWELEDVT